MLVQSNSTFPHELSTQELEVLTGLTTLDGALMDRMWNDDNKLSVNFDNLSLNFDKLLVEILSNIVEVA